MVRALSVENTYPEMTKRLKQITAHYVIEKEQDRPDGNIEIPMIQTMLLYLLEHSPSPSNRGVFADVCKAVGVDRLRAYGWRKTFSGNQSEFGSYVDQLISPETSKATGERNWQQRYSEYLDKIKQEWTVDLRLPPEDLNKILGTRSSAAATASLPEADRLVRLATPEEVALVAPPRTVEDILKKGADDWLQDCRQGKQGTAPTR